MYSFIFTFTNSVDPDKMQHYAAFRKVLIWGLVKGTMNTFHLTNCNNLYKNEFLSFELTEFLF